MAAASVASPAAVESSAATVKAATAMVGAGNIAVITAANVAACRSAAIDAAIYGAVSVTCSSISIPRPAIPATSVVTAIPGSGAYERAAYKPVRTVVAIGRASVRIIPVIAIRADWSGAHARVNRSNANTHGNLGMRGSSGVNRRSTL